MKPNSILRFSFITGNGQARTFDKTLEKLVNVIIYDAKNTPITIPQICDYLEKDYELSFTHEEIKAVISSSIKKQDITLIQDEKQQKFMLSPKLQNKMCQNDTSGIFEEIIKRFVKQNPVPNSIEEIKAIISSFLYQAFNINKQALLDLVNKKYEDVLNSILVKEEDKYIVNNFLNWEDEKKDIFVFNTISYCVDYCMLTIKKDSRNLNNVFQGKKFYLDANVIFRLAGFNNEERKNVMSAFVNRCKDCRIQLCYTNFTYDEIMRTISGIVKGVKEHFENKEPLNYKQYERYMPTYTQKEYIELFIKWKSEQNSYSGYTDYKSFAQYLIRIIDRTIRQFKRVDFTDISVKDRTNVEHYTNSLRQYKEENNRSAYETALKVDINNFLYVLEQRKNETCTSAYDTNNYIISTDARYCQWSKQILPGTVPVCVLPSVWFSLMLKFVGRTNNDYRSFELFLNMRYRNFETEEVRKKAEILAIVEGLDVTTNTKELILDDIHSQLIDSLIDINNEEPDEIVKKAQNDVLEKEKERLKNEYNTSLSMEKINTIKKLAKNKAEAKLNLRSKIIKIISGTWNFISMISGLILIGILIYLILSKKILEVFAMVSSHEYGFDFTHYLAIITLGQQAINLIIKPIKKKVKFKNLDELTEKEYNKLIKLAGDYSED